MALLTALSLLPVVWGHTHPQEATTTEIKTAEMGQNIFQYCFPLTPAEEKEDELCVETLRRLTSLMDSKTVAEEANSHMASCGDEHRPIPEGGSQHVNEIRRLRKEIKQLCDNGFSKRILREKACREKKVQELSQQRIRRSNHIVSQHNKKSK
jgi:signal recognition particle GTPase